MLVNIGNTYINPNTIEQVFQVYCEREPYGVVITTITGHRIEIRTDKSVADFVEYLNSASKI